MVVWWNMVRPDVRGTSRGRASHLCGQQQLGCSYKQGNNHYIKCEYSNV